MPRINVKSLGREIKVANNSQTVFQHLQENRLDWMHACGTKGRCTTCRMIVIGGMENLSEPSESEMNYQLMKRLAADERLACQCTLLGDITIRVPASCQLPHLDYLD